ncbi:low affinity immunoglobulin gamma Fc region receptor II-b-like isoform X2 [Pteropus medius]|uniref:low affinity immunoglobulin gamma Fc region receptor II-b-like isoform X2 n=1 Tax=Pteropus vampyrus TaxID=132908 RepID=UPI00196A51C9|nr:low affinity immunoglobulin gamma Fc region receptor II-b-like isoform X2 [Pteropus giganteus]XP_039695792.1 low affinity immunoglobulin gamma Fc region receptor II-b-like isoform X2 [Pteropus giganteus]XP_039695793.1 low affinity immunoglobulin gamma Fc region receptor II-b-like isoform X2 [Pteropus giganteus]
MLRNVHPWSLWLLPPLTVLLLLTSADREAGLPKATLSLEPPWINVLLGDNVTLTCQGAPGPGSPSTRWFHNGNSLETQAQSSYSLTANISDSGDYTCHTAQTSLSDPVHLDVISGWLLLQTPRLLFQEGESIMLRCHSWKDKPLYKVTFFQNKTSRKFSNTNFFFSIPRANGSHSGEYHCTGFIGKMRHSSPRVSITVRGSSSSSTLLVTAIVAVVAGIAATVVVIAVVAWFRLRRKQTSGTPEHRAMGDTLPEEPATITDAEGEAKVKDENSITYSLLLHPEALEEETESSDYQNM